MQLQAQDDHRATDLPGPVSVRGGEERQVKPERVTLRLTIRLTLLLPEDKEETIEGQNMSVAGVMESYKLIQPMLLILSKDNT